MVICIRYVPPVWICVSRMCCQPTWRLLYTCPLFPSGVLWLSEHLATLPHGAHELIVQVLMFVAHGVKGGTECSGAGSSAMFADRFESSSSRGAVYAIASVSSLTV